ncbi:DUF484 family protein [Pseudomarimonas arenosa]|uniref:DUF484 family protein n=1 Tax=Pseudomarimonas arenosa TaxID=2774145 RepID=A0AAW3ZGM2_9GAMM|nr:DUF484 family protein [Pseudomarimonas arenosa]MBD8525166.1 DUF484 family protein [Pseudomarimonas arenosa]
MSDGTAQSLSAHEVAGYLRRHPDFLAQYPDLALNLTMPREAGEATSLLSYQVEVLRDKNRELNRRLHELFRNAEDNERLAVRTHQLALSLIRASSASGALRAMVASLQEDFGSELIRIMLFKSVAGIGETDWLRVRDPQHADWVPFRDFMAGDEPLCGRVHKDKLECLFGDKSELVQSVALLPLNGRGMLAIATHDPHRFFPGMGTLFLRLMAESLGVAMARYEQEGG